ncbi:hypothetical protein SKAU_G00153690 [Synaphobranchus kaupii]|uniref:Uncharacterized protein n=1 Tax=Synaphobranchus kaupii TaxID=118154 RepID=A0A9Q1IWY0_SYNKA|nr:hypothetical protein SKAU_G00153690 [Synaphobranchus kaupii]
MSPAVCSDPQLKLYTVSQKSAEKQRRGVTVVEEPLPLPDPVHQTAYGRAARPSPGDDRQRISTTSVKSLAARRMPRRVGPLVHIPRVRTPDGKAGRLTNDRAKYTLSLHQLVRAVPFPSGDSPEAF